MPHYHYTCLLQQKKEDKINLQTTIKGNIDQIPSVTYHKSIISTAVLQVTKTIVPNVYTIICSIVSFLRNLST